MTLKCTAADQMQPTCWVILLPLEMCSPCAEVPMKYYTDFMGPCPDLRVQVVGRHYTVRALR